ncbi:DUF6153 family protein [Microbacterium sp. YY-03]|uniref:Uncharacterized protein n=1 Tax=Gulosibacter chungangensis TaxID=979746 RepID=A0A7J5BAU2_9MICO|nr:DUF6153 family protein [Gulosibacter chungangensis]KAB1641473.1 hypothetical protein F8O05_12925 [Gulosibacter chungangensis]
MGYYESVVVRGKLRPAHRLIGAAWRWILPAAAALFMILGLLGMHSIAPHAGDSTEPQAKHSKVVDTGHAGGTAQAASGTDACASCGDHAPDGGMALMCGMILLAIIGLTLIRPIRRILARLPRLLLRIRPPQLHAGGHLRPSLVFLSISRT